MIGVRCRAKNAGDRGGVPRASTADGLDTVCLEAARDVGHAATGAMLPDDPLRDVVRHTLWPSKPDALCLPL